MIGDKDPRDIDITDPDAYFKYTPADVTPNRSNYILKENLERLREGEIPGERDFSTGMGANYYKNTNGRYGGSACAAYFLRSKEIRDYLMADEEFLNRAIKSDKTWFLPKDIEEIFVF